MTPLNQAARPLFDTSVAPLSEIRDAVRHEWINDARQKARAKLYAGLLARYSVTVQAAPGAGS